MCLTPVHHTHDLHIKPGRVAVVARWLRAVGEASLRLVTRHSWVDCCLTFEVTAAAWILKLILWSMQIPRLLVQFFDVTGVSYRLILVSSLRRETMWWVMMCMISLFFGVNLMLSSSALSTRWLSCFCRIWEASFWMGAP